MARATRSSTSTADLKRKRSDSITVNSVKQQRTDHPDPIDGRHILRVLADQDTQGLLDRVFQEQPASLRSLLSTPTPLPVLKAALAHLRPISALPRARLSPTAAQQLRFCDLALSLLDQATPSSAHLSRTSILDSPDSSPERPQPSYALVQHLPTRDYWSSLTSLPSPANVHTGNAELVAILPSPSSSSEQQTSTLGSYSTKQLPPKKPPLSRRIVTTGAFLDYGASSSFAPSFDQEGELVGRRELGQVLFFQEEKKRVREARIRERFEARASIVELPQDHPEDPSETIPVPDLDLDSLLPPDQVDSIKEALHSLELENSVQTLLERNQQALVRLEELQMQRIKANPTSIPEEGSEEWDTAQAIVDSLTVLASLRPRSSSEPNSTFMPPPSVLHKLHRTLALDPSPGWSGTLPPGHLTALRDDATVKVRAGVPAPAPVAPAPAMATAPAPATNTFGNFAYAYNPQQPQVYRPQAPSYTPYKPGQAPSYYQSYVPPGTQQPQTYYSQPSYATGTTNQQPYGAATGQQPYASYSSWYSQYPAPVQNAAGTTPQPIIATPATMPSTYGGFFNTTATAAGTPPVAARTTTAVANTVVANVASYPQTPGAVPTLPAHLRPAQAVNGSPTPFQAQQSYYGTYQMQTQPARLS
ncbi:hypothetical protein B0H34DRAFT_792519 [Crassisporium funariophilum]|nr:hypothetical protein B0H34DRAFT_792519 [Crassisporium funariophilum]